MTDPEFSNDDLHSMVYGEKQYTDKDLETLIENRFGKLDVVVIEREAWVQFLEDLNAVGRGELQFAYTPIALFFSKPPV